MTSSGTLTKDELRDTKVWFRRDTSHVYVGLTVDVDAGPERSGIYEAEVHLESPTAREHGALTANLDDLWSLIEEKVESQEPESSDEPQAL
jgi:hypothetical protein